MRGSFTTDRTAEDTLPRTARNAGLFYLLNIITIFIAVFCFRGLIVSGDPAATATNLLAHQVRFRIGFAFELISTACSIAVAALLCELFLPVNGSLAVLAASFRLVACAIAAVGYLFQLAPLQIFGAAPHYLSVLTLEELRAVALLLNSFSGHASRLSIVFFGFHFEVIAYLIFRSNFGSRTLGVFVAAAGLGGLMFLVPTLAAGLFLYFVPIGLLCELSLAAALLLARGSPQPRRRRSGAAAVES